MTWQVRNSLSSLRLAPGWQTHASDRQDGTPVSVDFPAGKGGPGGSKTRANCGAGSGLPEVR